VGRGNSSFLFFGFLALGRGWVLFFFFFFLVVSGWESTALPPFPQEPPPMSLSPSPVVFSEPSLP